MLVFERPVTAFTSGSLINVTSSVMLGVSTAGRCGFFLGRAGELCIGFESGVSYTGTGFFTEPPNWTVVQVLMCLGWIRISVKFSGSGDTICSAREIPPDFKIA